MAASLLKPLRLKFDDPEDAAAYGSGWWIYDESKIVKLRAREQMALEIEIGVPLVDVMSGVRASSAMGDMAAAWLAIKLTPGAKAPPFETFNPITMAITWEPVPVEDLEPGKEESTAGEPISEPLPVEMEPGGSTDILPSELARPVDWSTPVPTSSTDTVSLIVMPVSESNAS